MGLGNFCLSHRCLCHRLGTSLTHGTVCGPIGLSMDTLNCLRTHWTVYGHTGLSVDPLDCQRTHWTVYGPIGLSTDTLDCLWTHWTVYGCTGLSMDLPDYADPLDCLLTHHIIYHPTRLAADQLDCRTGLWIHWTVCGPTFCGPGGLSMEYGPTGLSVDLLDYLWTQWIVYGVWTHWTVGLLDCVQTRRTVFIVWATYSTRLSTEPVDCVWSDQTIYGVDLLDRPARLPYCLCIFLTVYEPARLSTQTVELLFEFHILICFSTSL